MGLLADSEKARLDGLRLECLKLASKHDDVDMNRVDVLAQAASYFDYVTDAPKGPTAPFVIHRTDDFAKDSDEAKKAYVGVYGTYVYWVNDFGAYLFRSRDEAGAFLLRHGPSLFRREGPWPARIDEAPHLTGAL